MEEVEWLKLPHDLQTQFFKVADEESREVTETIKELYSELGKLRVLDPYFERLRSNDLSYTVAAVDGSRSPHLSERLGAKYGVLAVGAVVLRGTERIDERFEAGRFTRGRALSRERSSYFFDLLSMCLERAFMKELLDRADVDVLILDGSFYGFVYTARRIKKQIGGLFEPDSDEYKVFRKACELTDKLLESGKVIGVIKRSHSRVIGGWLAHTESPKNKFTTVLDKLILAHIMPPSTIFRYEKLTGEVPAYVYTQMALMASRNIWGEEPLKMAMDRAYAPYRELRVNMEKVKSLRRVQVKAFSTPPCEIEYPSSLSFEKLEEWIGQRKFFNEVTGLPMALDVVDSLVGLSSKFTEEFVSEVEARTLERLVSENLSMDVIRWFFALLNPQKGVGI